MASTWTTDVSGVLKNHSLSAKIREAAVAETIILPYLSVEPGFGKGKGETHNITRLSALAEPANARLTENQRIPIDNFTINVNGITVTEWGRGVSFTSLERDLLHFDLRSQVQRLLKQQQSLGLDAGAGVALKATQIKADLTSTSTITFNPNGVFTNTSTRSLLASDIDAIQDYLFDTLFAPPYEGEDYVGIFRTSSLRGLMNDSGWQIWHQYTDPQAKWNNEAGRHSDVRLIKCNHATALGEVGTSDILGEGVVFGEDAAVMVEAMTPELFVESADFGREQAVAWRGILEFGCTWPTGNPGEAKSVHVGSLT